MERSIKLALHKFQQVPKSLQDPENGYPVAEIPVNLTNLFHHYYLDSYGVTLPNPDPAQFEYLRFILTTPDFRLSGDGIGACTDARRHSSTALGQAFCRWFLHDHLGITYFAHMQQVLNKPPHNAFGGLQLKRIEKGYVPDYVCCRDPENVFLAEAKGRYTPISFKNKEFNSWRRQFDHVQATDKSGTTHKIKGYIVGTRFATEEGPERAQSGLFAEDPESPGDIPLGADASADFGGTVLALHYANIATKLRQHRLAAALQSGIALDPQMIIQALVWEYRGPVLERRRFVGGFFQTDADTPVRFTEEKGRYFPNTNSPALNGNRGTFFGLEESIFRGVVNLARSHGASRRPDTLPYTETLPFYSAISTLRDGTIFAPIEFFTVEGGFEV